LSPFVSFRAFLHRDSSRHLIVTAGGGRAAVGCERD
jgi:hypothetical protein